MRRKIAGAMLELAALVGGTVTGMMFPTISTWLGTLLLGTCVAMALTGFALLLPWRVVLHHSAQRAEPSIPIAFKQIRNSYFANYAYAGGPTPEGQPQQPQVLAYGEVTIANISRTQAVSLELNLHLTSDDGWNMRLPASPRDDFGRDFTQVSGSAQAIERHGIRSPPFFENPIHIRPNEIVTGRLVFLFTPFDEEMRGAFAAKFVRDEFKANLSIFDIFSGSELNLPLPASYRGSDLLHPQPI